MKEKTPLEFDLEQHEKRSTPVSVKTLMVVLILCLSITGVYTFKLKRELAQIEREAVVMKETFSKEKIALLRQIKQLQAKSEGSDSNRKM